MPSKCSSAGHTSVSAIVGLHFWGMLHQKIKAKEPFILGGSHCAKLVLYPFFMASDSSQTWTPRPATQPSDSHRRHLKFAAAFRPNTQQVFLSIGNSSSFMVDFPLVILVFRGKYSNSFVLKDYFETFSIHTRLSINTLDLPTWPCRPVASKMYCHSGSDEPFSAIFTPRLLHKIA